MGVFYGLARRRELHGNKAGARTCYLLAYLLPVIEHGFYDAALSLESDLLSLTAMITDLVFIFVAFMLINRAAKRDAPLNPAGATRHMQSHLPLSPQRPQAPSGQRSDGPSVHYSSQNRDDRS